MGLLIFLKICSFCCLLFFFRWIFLAVCVGGRFYFDFCFQLCFWVLDFKTGLLFLVLVYVWCLICF